jgi:NADH:ubiquinone oxidoreductase subunit 5 (subunit L)/multisubunit Na+/H+ antiporter MnhA subunit
MLLPLSTAVTIALFRRSPRAQAPVALAGLVATAALGGWAAAAEPSAALGWGPRLALELSVAGFGRVMAVVVPAVATPIVMYAAAAERDGRSRLLALLVAFVGVMELLVAAADFLTLLIGWELVGALSWTLIGHGWRDPDNPRAAVEAFVTTRFGDLGLYLAAGMAFAATGSFRFADLGAARGPELDLVASGVLLAAAAKSAQLPFSPWLSSAMAGPTPVSALLHSSTMVAAGAYLLIRLAPALEGAGWFEPVALALGLATALAGGVVATLQTHAKRALAGSTSAQYGLMFAAVGAGSTAAAAAQLVTHAAFKSLLFLSAGVAIHAVGHPDLRGMHLGRALPRVAALAAVGALALAAVPPLGGAWSKEEIVAAVAGDLAGWRAVAVFTASFLSTLYTSRFWVMAFGPEPHRGALGNPLAVLRPRSPRAVGSRRHLAHRPGRIEVASLAALAAASLALGALWLPGGGRVVETLVAGELPEGPTVVIHRLHEQLISLAVIAGATLAVWILIRRGRLASSGVPAPLRTRVADWFAIATVARGAVVDPVLAASRALAHFDDRVVDAGVRGAAAVASALSRLLARRAEVSIDGVVHALAGLAMRAAAGSRTSDERAVDAAVEGIAREVGVAGRGIRRIQTGLAHHYYVLVAAGAAAALAVLAFVR